ncbi:MFS transporter [Streptomyces koyangensis]|uniref:MFS transporter n=2 Tax=Streptomyces koyangensis TaxID=188770 RepID=UPI003667A88A
MKVPGISMIPLMRTASPWKPGALRWSCERSSEGIATRPSGHALRAAPEALTARFRRKQLLVVGWLLGIPAPFAPSYAPSWGWIVAANVLLGLNQGLTWSMTVNMKIDLVGPARRGLATGLNDAAGYTAVGVNRPAHRLPRHQLRPTPGPRTHRGHLRRRGPRTHPGRPGHRRPRRPRTGQPHQAPTDG